MKWGWKLQLPKFSLVQMSPVAVIQQVHVFVRCSKDCHSHEGFLFVVLFFKLQRYNENCLACRFHCPLRLKDTYLCTVCTCYCFVSFLFSFMQVVLHLQNRCLFYAKTWPTLKHNSTSTALVSIVQPSQTVTVSYVSGTVVLCITLFKMDVSWTAFCTAQVSPSPVLLSAILCLLLVRKLGFLPALFTSHTKMLDLCGADHACKRPSGCWKSKNRTGRFPSCLDKTDTNLLLQSHCKKEHVHHTAWTLGTTAWLQSSSFFPCIFYHFLFCSFDSVVVPYYGEAFPIFDI